MAVSPDGHRLYIVNGSSDNIFGFSIGADGALTPLAGSPFGAGDAPDGVAVSPDGRRVYVANYTSDNFSAYTIGQDGALTPLTGSPFGTGGSSPAFQSLAIQPNQGAAAKVLGHPRRGGRGYPLRRRGLGRPDGGIARYDWEFGDGPKLPNAGPTPSHRYSKAGDYRVTPDRHRRRRLLGHPGVHRADRPLQRNGGRGGRAHGVDPSGGPTARRPPATPGGPGGDDQPPEGDRQDADGGGGQRGAQAGGGADSTGGRFSWPAGHCFGSG